MRPATRARRPRGAALIEFVLVAPLFLMLLLGAIDWGWYFVVRQTVVNATRQGARTASVQESQGDALTAGVAATRDYLSRVAVTSIPARDPEVRIVTLSVAGVATPVSAVSVRLVGYPSSSISGLSWTLVPATINAETVMRLEVQP